jgi:hypothetical protein
MVMAVTPPESMAAVAVAPLPSPMPSVIFTHGTDVWPTPKVSSVTLRALSVAVQEAPCPGLFLIGSITVPSRMTTLGADE